MSFNGFANIDLSKVEVDEAPVKEALQAGKHTVKISDAKVEAQGKKHTLTLSYENDKGAIRQWLDIVDDLHEKSVEINWKIIKKLLLLLGHEAEETPDVSFFVGKTIGINIKENQWEGRKQLRVNYHWMPDTSSASTSKDIDDMIPF